ncbi:MAG: carboxymuconolactone decarboxylase family protein [Rhodospirillales bacterium]|nr:carboxymuconolactone decarboxylase family protein [Rhodospirillales bacterium]
MTTVRMVEYEDASAEVRAVYDDIMESRGIDFVPNFWKTIAHHPPTLKAVWAHLKRVMAPGALDARTKEMIAIAVSATNACEYCINSHIAGARKLGMTDAEFGELMAVIGMFNQTNKLVEGYQVQVDERIRRFVQGEDGKGPLPRETAQPKRSRSSKRAAAQRAGGRYSTKARH